MPVPKIDITRPQSARVWNYLLGGKDNYPADRQVGDAIVAELPGIREVARQGRQFLARAVTHLASEAGVDQFLDIGTGLPTMENTHEVAQRVDPRARIVYVDNDDLVLTHANALLGNVSPAGATSYVEADVRRPEHGARAGPRRCWTSTARSRCCCSASSATRPPCSTTCWRSSTR